MESIKDRLAQILRSKNLTASQFAELMEIQPSNVSHLLNGRNKPSLDFLIKLKEVFPEYSFDWIILGKKPMTQVENSTNANQTKKSNEESASNVVDDILQFPTDNDSYCNDNQYDEFPKKDLKCNNEKVEKLVVIYGDKSFEILKAR